MKNVVKFAPRSNKKAPVKQVATGGFSFEAEVDKDIDNMCKALSIPESERERALEIAKDFYRKYPMLMEFVRQPNELLRK